MSNTNQFSKKFKELSSLQAEIEYTEDFFKKAFGEGDVSVLKQSAEQGHRDISHQFNDTDIDENWLEVHGSANFDGQLAIDVFQNDKEIVITSAVAGVRAEDIDIDMNGDMITIRGKREHKFGDIAQDDYFIRECFWGSFSRSIILPADIQHDNIRASLENGVLTVRLPKSTSPKNGKIQVEEIDIN